MVGELSVSAEMAFPVVLERVEMLLEKYKLLNYAVINNNTRNPRWTSDVEPLEARQIVSLTKEPAEEISQMTRAQERYATEHFDASCPPFWHVDVRPVLDMAGSCFISIIASHMISDGRSTLHLFAALIGEAPTFNYDFDPNASENLPPKAEDTLPFRPKFSVLARSTWEQLIIPRLPGSLRTAVESRCPWPASESIRVKPYQQATKSRELDLGPEPDEVTLGLKLLAIQAGTKTIHSLIGMAAATALLVATRNSATDRKKLTFKFETPVSFRDEALGHPRRTANYIGIRLWKFERSATLRRPIFDSARDYHSLISGKSGRRGAASESGMLAWIPDGQGKVVKDTLGMHRDPDTRGLSPAPTGWEQFWGGKMQEKRPYQTSLSLSNIGLLPTHPPMAPEFEGRLQKFVFQQSASPFGHVFTVDVTGNVMGPSAIVGKPRVRLGIMVAWREGVLDEETVHLFLDAFEVTLRVLGAVAKGAGENKFSVDARTTIGELQREVESRMY